MYCDKVKEFFPQPLLWMDVKGLAGYYEVSNYGNVRSLDREVVFTWKGAEVTRLFKGKTLAPKFDKDGYESYGLSKDKKKFHMRGHRIVATSFIKNPNNLAVVDHRDACVTHNTAWNLQWMTNTQNIIKYYAEDAGLVKSLSSLTEYEWKYVGFLYNEGLMYKDICANLGLGIKNPDSLWEGLSGGRLSSISGFKKGDFQKRKHPCTKVSVDVAYEVIRDRLLYAVPLKVLASKYGIAESMVSRFCSGKRQPEALIRFNKEYGK